MKRGSNVTCIFVWFAHCKIETSYYPPKKLRKRNVFSCVCLSTGGVPVLLYSPHPHYRAPAQPNPSPTGPHSGPPGYVQTWTCLYRTPPPPDMFKHLHYEVQTAGERMVGIQRPSTFILRWYICRYVEEIGLAAMMAAKRLASVTPEVDLREYVTGTPNKVAHSGFETQRRYQKKSKISKIGVSVTPQKGLMSFKNLNKKDGTFVLCTCD